MGAPRSGTTAVTRFLAAHPDVTLADAEALGTSPDGRPTFESGIFVRDLRDDEVLARFAAIDGRTPVVVEKTPVHILYIDRIRRLFPKARFILCHRPPIPCMRSWKVARATFLKHGTFEDACKMVARATDIMTERCGDDDTAVMRFTPFMEQPRAVGAALLQHLGLDDGPLDNCVTDMRDPKLERVKGVVGESLRGGTTRLTAEERAQVLEICGQAQEAWAQRQGKNVIRPLQQLVDSAQAEG